MSIIVHVVKSISYPVSIFFENFMSRGAIAKLVAASSHYTRRVRGYLPEMSSQWELNS